jgi:hypothetical protein
MSANYSKSSPYYGTPNWGNFLDLWSPRTFEMSPTDVVYKIDNFYNLRPDLLAHDLYQDASLWWVFAIRNPNKLKDPVFDFTTGKVIFIPPITALQAALH